MVGSNRKRYMDQQLSNILSSEELATVTGLSPARVHALVAGAGHHGRRHSVAAALRIVYVVALIDAGVDLSIARRLAGDTFPEHGELLTRAPLEAAC